jgi:hypothetical protein
VVLSWRSGAGAKKVILSLPPYLLLNKFYNTRQRQCASRRVAEKSSTVSKKARRLQTPVLPLPGSQIDTLGESAHRVPVSRLEPVEACGPRRS